MMGMLCFLSASCGEAAVSPPDSTEQPNHRPRISVPPTLADHDLPYSQTIVAWDPDGDSVRIGARTLPVWLTFDSVTAMLSGLPGLANIGDHQVVLTAWDGKVTAELSFTLTVRLGVSSLIFDGPWLSSQLFKFGHDGHPYESENFLVYSGFCEPTERQRVAWVLEGQLRDLKESFGVADNDEFAYTTEARKIYVFLSRYQHHENHWGGGFHWGFVYRSLDSPYYYAPPEAYDYQLNHELMHVVEYLLNNGSRGEVWFTEGIADCVSDLEHLRQRITSNGVLLAWMREHGNPVSIHAWSDYPPDLQANGLVGDYYAYFELAFRYLIDPSGLGKTLQDAKDLYLGQRQGLTFAAAFESSMGLSVAAYEASFAARMAQYLDP
jgi:hypothetical protein